MKKTTIKVSLVLAAITVLTLVPLNKDLIFGYDAPTFAGSSTNPPVCGKEKPATVVLYEPNHVLLPKATNPGDVRLNWLKAERASKYTIAFGLESGKYMYGLPDVGNTDHFTVSDLTPGTTYYFVVRGVNDCMPGAWSKEWAVTTAGGGNFTSLDTNAGTVVTPANIPATGVQGAADVQQPVEQPVQQPQPQQQTYTPPAEQPTPQASGGFFSNLWSGILGIFGL